jgi:serine/threonine protein kinase
MSSSILPIPRDQRLKVGRFIVRRWLGSGFQGKVFQAFDPILEREVAIKWLIAEEGAEAGDTADLSEARIVSKLEHPNIVPLYDTGEHRGLPYLVFAYIEGTTLQKSRVRGCAMPVEEALGLFKAVLEGVACAHAHGILHLDLTPGNIMIDAAGAPRIMDFGLAKLIGAKESGIGDGSVTGSPRYMSPEHFNGSPLTSRSDVFALGLILYELVTGQFPVQSDDLRVLVDTVAHRELDLKGMYHLGLDARLQAVIWRALRHDPGGRFADAVEMKYAVEGLLEPHSKSNHSTVEFLLTRMQHKANFPALSKNLLEINRLTDEASQSSIDILANVVLRDYAVTNRILKLANSSFYGRTNHGVKTISDAIRLLGMSVIRMTCNGLSYFSAMKSADHHLKDALICSFASALIGRHLAIRLGRQDLAEEAFICGMFNRLGKSLVIFYFEEEFREIERLVEEGGLDDEMASARMLGIGYSDLGMAVVARWNFPDTIRQSMKYLGPGNLPKPANPVEIYQQIATFSNELCQLAAHAVADRRSSRLMEFSDRFAGLIATTPDELLELLQSAFDKLEEFGPVLGLELGGSQFVSKVGDFLSSTQAPVVETGGANARDSV